MDDKERARRIRQQQISARNPGDSKIRGYDWSKHNKKAKRVAAVQRKKQQQPIIVEFWELLPKRWKGVIFGVCFSMIAVIPLLLMLPQAWHVMALLPMLIFGIGGFVVGKVLED